MRIGSVWIYKGRPVYITGGRYQGRHGVSNYWNFQYIKNDGTLGEGGSDYDNGPFTEEITNVHVTITIQLPEEYHAD